jgi:hypothetical protein
VGFSPRVFSTFPAFVLAPAATAAIALGLADAPVGATRQAGQAPEQAGKAAPTAASRAHAGELFQTSDGCIACHNSLTTPSGEDVSIGPSWRGSIMANSSRDPYWQAAVRRETLDHPTAAADIQDECSICHMPMARATANANGRKGQVFAHLPVGRSDNPQDLLAHDGVSCTMCHQITNEKLGTPASFTGGFVVNVTQPTPRFLFGPFQIDKGQTTIMQSASEFQPTEAAHIRQSELCATCHTLYTKALDSKGQVIGQLPEQVMYLEWRHSAFQTEQRSCQSCHMPVVQEETPISSVLGQPRQGFARHVFVGGNFFMLRLLNRYRVDLGVTALPGELETSARRTVQNLQSATATVSVERAEASGGRLEIDVAVENLTGHKLPTAYPSRRAWLHLTVRDRSGRQVFESGAIAASGLIQGNDNDNDATTFEPHYTEIRQPSQVQIYESIMGDADGVPTTGLLTGLRYLKDNRLLPRGFDKASAEPDIMVVGGATQDGDFTGSGDHVRYSVDVEGSDGPFQVDVELRFQPIAFRWAENLKPYGAPEPRRFISYYESMSFTSSEVLAHVAATSR